MKIRNTAEVIKFRLRTEAGLTIKDLAKNLGRSPSTISLVICGHRKSFPVISEIARLLGEDPEELATLLGETEGETLMT
jgi:transcriptional regulator with XRE-family HTH domain